MVITDLRISCARVLVGYGCILKFLWDSLPAGLQLQLPVYPRNRMASAMKLNYSDEEVRASTSLVCPHPAVLLPEPLHHAIYRKYFWL